MDFIIEYSNDKIIIVLTGEINKIPCDVLWKSVDASCFTSVTNNTFLHYKDAVKLFFEMIGVAQQNIVTFKKLF